MHEVSEKLAEITETEIVSAFRDALVAMLPILQRLDCISDDTQPYDPYDSVADTLWNVLVAQSLQWKYGLESPPRLPRYGFSDTRPGPGGYIEVRSPSSEPFRFIQFLGDRTVGPEPFNSVRGVSTTGLQKSVTFGDKVSFSWVRAEDEAGA